MRAGRLPLILVPFFLLVTGYGCFGPIGTAACGGSVGFGPALLESVNACPQATEKLGTPVSFSPLGLTFGNYESGGDVGEGIAYGDIPVTGPKGRAIADYMLSKSGGVWSSSKLVLTFADASKLDVKACTRGLEAERGKQASDRLLTQGCDEGRADLCLALSLTLQARNELERAKAMRAKACQLGLQSACAAP